MRRTLGMLMAALALLAGMAPTRPASAESPGRADGLGRHTRFTETDLVSDIPGRAPLQDPKLVNPWGLALSPTGPLWAANNGTGVATVYAGGAKGVKKQALEVTVEGGAPTGEVFNNTAEFAVKGAPATFIFSSESGAITAWNRNTGTTAVRVAGARGAIYKGLALLHTRHGAFLLATDFHNGRIDVFDGRFRRLRLPGKRFNDPSIPRGFAPFNVAVLGRSVFVTYAKQDADAEDDVPGPGLGFVVEYRRFGRFHHRFASRGPLNAPWGLVIAPRSFGDFAGDVLVGNFGDGRINAFTRHGRWRGALRRPDGRPIEIDGLWSLLRGTPTTGGTDAVWFSAGPNDETHGLVGLLRKARLH
ncbi:TIGR03118 family protein [Actinomadura sp. NPDC048032]|uniref:TIGR03118 family protein n=1 Tax=Actinomadura sp. NPDC048032 TaxID=3155747 RepID=UPI0033EC0436